MYHEGDKVPVNGKQVTIISYQIISGEVWYEIPCDEPDKKTEWIHESNVDTWQY